MVNRESYVRLENNNMEAWLCLYPPVGAECYTKDEILSFLKSNDVVHGFIESNIAAICKKKIYEREIRVAKGEEPIEGHSGYFEYLFETDLEKLKKPTVLSNGSVDYRSVNSIQNIKKNDLVVRYHESEPGVDGIDVTGTIIQTADVRELTPLTGKGIVQDEQNPYNYYAEFDGRIDYDASTGKVSIIEVYTISGDAGLATYPLIEFNGDVIITGGVESGVIIRAGKTLTVDGVVEAADIQAGGDIIIKRGILGNTTGKIVSTGGDVIADFIEHANVKALKNVKANIIMNSNVSANGKVLLEGKKGYIMGGYVHGLGGIKAVSVGNDAEIKTVVHCGLEAKYIEKRVIITRELTLAETQLSEVLDEMKELADLKKKGKLPKDKISKIGQLKSEREALEGNRAKYKKQLAKIGELETSAMEAVIRIEGSIYRGTVISAGAHEMLIDRDTSYTEYFCKSGIIQSNVFSMN